MQSYLSFVHLTYYALIAILLYILYIQYSIHYSCNVFIFILYFLIFSAYPILSQKSSFNVVNA